MPNWCHNTLQVWGSEEELHKWVERAASSPDPHMSAQPLRFEAFYPIPPGTEDELGWCSRHWGTKWDASFSAPLLKPGRGRQAAFSLQEGLATYRFDTAWAPPALWLQRVAEKYPGLDFSLTYGEPGMCFGGSIEYSGGEMFSLEEGYAEEYLRPSEMWF